MEAATLAALAGTTVCADGCASSTCGDMYVRTFLPAAFLVALALTVTNSYVTATASVAVDTGELAGGGKQHACGHFVPCHYMDAELQEEDPRLQRLTDANHRLCRVYGNTIHQNDGPHLDGGISAAEDAKWQRFHLWAAACQLLLYNLSNG